MTGRRISMHSREFGAVRKFQRNFVDDPITLQLIHAAWENQKLNPPLPKGKATTVSLYP
jgi:hypothetical protein